MPRTRFLARRNAVSARFGRRGANAVEFALVVPVLIAFILGIIDFGWYFSQQAVVTNCVREGARTGALTRQNAGPVTAAQARVTACVAAGNLPAATTNTAVLSGVAPDQLITVTLAVPYTRLTGLIPMPTSLNGQVIMRMENQPPPPAPVP